MKTLNRPMFRYGGPIKEGVMHGIREPKRNGGSMGINTPKRGLVDGPGSYAGFIPPLIAAGSAALRYLPAVYRGIRGSKFVRGFKPTGNFRTVAGKDPSKAYVKGDFTAFSGSPSSKMGVLQALKDPTRLGAAIRENPGTTTSIASLLGYGGKELLGGEEIPTNTLTARKTKRKKGTSGAPGGGDPDMYLEPRAPEAKELTEAERIELENKARREKMDSYRKIMDIKGMSKDAAYKSLIDVSKIIQEGGNLKKSLKDGSLIQKVTAAASKRFDKVSDTETALRSLVAKGEIQKEMDKDKNALDKEYKRGVIDMNKKKMSGPTLLESINEYVVKNKKPPSGNNLATLIVGKGGVVEDVVDTMLVDKHIKAGGDSVSFMESIVAKNLEKGEIVPAGTYVVKDSIVVVDENGNVTSPYKIS